MRDVNIEIDVGTIRKVEVDISKSRNIDLDLQYANIEVARLDAVTVTPSASSQHITPPENLDGFNEVNVEATPLQVKQATPTETSQVIIPDADKVGLSSVEIAGAPLQEKTVAGSKSAQTIEADNQYFGLKRVLVNGYTPITEEKTITATKSQQIVTPSADKDGLSKVTVNGYTPVTEEKTAQASKTQQVITKSANVDGMSKVTIEGYVPDTETKQVSYTENGNYSVNKSANKDGMSQVDIVVNVPTGVKECATEAEMDEYLETGESGEIVKYTGTTTSKYENGGVYKIERVDVTRMPVSGFTYTFVDSAIQIAGYDADVYGGLSQSNNQGKHNTQSVCKLIISGATSFTLWINSYAESNYDYTIASKLDAASVPTQYTHATVKQHTRSFQYDPTTGLNETCWKKVVYTSADGLDGGEHFIYVVFTKDNSADRNSDTGYFCYEKVKGYAKMIVPTGRVDITSTNVVDVTNYASARVVDGDLIPSNIKKDVDILGVVGTFEGGGGGGGYRVFVTHIGGGTYDGITCSVNEETPFEVMSESSPHNYFWDSLNGITSLQFGAISSHHWGSDSYAEWRPYGSTGSYTRLAINVKFTLTQDIELRIRTGTCLVKGTLITMADGTKKPVEDIVIGDYVLGYDGKPHLVHRSEHGNRVFAEDQDRWIFEDGYEVITTRQHRFYNFENQKMMYLHEWKIGDHAITEMGEKVALLEHIHEDTPCLYFSLWCDNENYFAGGLLAGNRFTPELHII